MFLSVKEKEKYVIELRKQGKSYKDIAYELKISPRDISKILKKLTGEIEEKERKKIVLSKTAHALQLYKKGKSPIDVAIKLDLSTQEANSLYQNYLSLNNKYNFVETFKEFDNNDDSLQDFLEYYYFIKENGITKEELVEAIKKSNDLPNIIDEYNGVFNQLPELQKERDFYVSDNKLLRYKNCEINDEYNSLLSKIESKNKVLKLTEYEINNKIEILETIKNSEDYIIFNNKVEEQVKYFLNQKKEFFKLAITSLFDIIKKDPDKDILIRNILNSNENPNSEFYFDLYEEKIAQIAADTLVDIALEINKNNILNS